MFYPPYPNSYLLREQRNFVLANFNVEEIENPTTFATIKEMLTSLDKNFMAEMKKVILALS